MSIEKKKVSLEEYLDNVLAEISSKNLTAPEADDYSEDIIDQIEYKYNINIIFLVKRVSRRLQKNT